MDTMLTTPGDVIEALGGAKTTAEIFGVTAKVVSAWKANGRIPPKFYLLGSAALKERGKQAASVVWGMTEPEAA